MCFEAFLHQLGVAPHLAIPEQTAKKLPPGAALQCAAQWKHAASSSQVRALSGVERSGRNRRFRRALGRRVGDTQRSLLAHTRRWRGTHAQLAAMLLPALRLATEAEAAGAGSSTCNRTEQCRWVVQLLESYTAHAETLLVLRSALVAACEYPCGQLRVEAVAANPRLSNSRNCAHIGRYMSTPFLETALRPPLHSHRDTVATFDRLRSMLPCLPLQSPGPLPPRVFAVLVRPTSLSAFPLSDPFPRPQP